MLPAVLEPLRRHRVQWLSDNASIFTGYKTIDITLALNLEPCFTPVESPESKGMAEAFVKTFKRDYVQSEPDPLPQQRSLKSTPGWRTTNSTRQLDDRPSSRQGQKTEVNITNRRYHK
jgi:transposase InsO family protein